MADITAIGGYPIEAGTPVNNDILWFTGESWKMIPYGTQGNIYTLISPPSANVSFICGDYFVEINNLQPGDCLSMVAMSFTDPYVRMVGTKGIVTNVPYRKLYAATQIPALSKSVLGGEGAESSKSITKPTTQYSTQLS